MKFHDLIIQNFLTVGTAHVGLDNKGLVLIQGDNQDDPSAKSNGAGKSTIPDALCWVLYGVTARGVKGDDVINVNAKKDCFVQVEFQDGESHYMVTRYRKSKTKGNLLEIYASSGCRVGSAGPAAMPMHKGTDKETQEVLTKIMGCTLEVFMAAIYAGQEMMPDLPKMTDRELKLLIEEAAGIEMIERAYAIARTKYNTALKNVEVQEAVVGTHIRMLDVSIRRHAEAMTLAEKWASDRPVVLAKFKETVLLMREILAKKTADYQAQVEQRYPEKLAGINANIAAHSAVLKQRDELQAAVAKASSNLRLAESNLAAAMKLVANRKTHHDHLKSGKPTPCPECGKPPTPEEVESVIEKATASFKEAIREAQESKACRDSLALALDEATKTLEEFQKTMPDMSKLLAAQKALTDEVTKEADLKMKMMLAEKDLLKAEADIASERAVVNPYTATVELEEKSFKANKDNLEHQQSKVKELEFELEIATGAMKVFGPAGVRAHILDTVTPFLNARTADYLSALSDGNIRASWSTLGETTKGELREKFNIDVENDKGSKTFMGLSGGEKRKVRLATMMALQDLVATRATKPIDLWIGDEIDDALDDAGLERLMTILERRAREKGTVLVISHNELTDWCDSVATVTKSGGYSTVTGALSVEEPRTGELRAAA